MAERLKFLKIIGQCIKPHINYVILSLSKNTFGERPSAISLKFTVPKVSKILIFYDDSLISSSASVSVLLSFLAGALLFYLKAKNYKDGFLPDPPSGSKSTCDCSSGQKLYRKTHVSQ